MLISPKAFPDVVFLKVDVVVRKLARIGGRYGIKGVPTFLFMKVGHTMYRVVGGGAGTNTCQFTNLML